MTSRERVIAAIERTNPDRVPIDLGGTYYSNILAAPYYQLLKFLKIHKDVKIADYFQMSVYVDEEVSNRFNTDVIILWPLRDYLGIRRDTAYKEWIMPSGTPVKVSKDFNLIKNKDGSYIYKKGLQEYRMPKDGFYFDMINNPYQWVETTKDVEKIKISPINGEEKEWLKIQSEKLRRSTDKFIVFDFDGGWVDIANFLIGTEKFYIDIISNKRMIHALMEKLNEIWKKNIDIIIAATGTNTDCIAMACDLGSNESGLFKTSTIKEMVIPYIKEFYEYVRKVSNYYIFFHTCGSVYQYLPDLIDAGVNIINPVQVGAKNMEPKKLKNEFGKHVTFWGGSVDPQHVLPHKSRQIIKEQATYHTEIFQKGGGFIFAPVHNIQPYVPPENIVELFDTAFKVGKY